MLGENEKGGYNAACMFCILRGHHAVGIVFLYLNVFDMIFINALGDYRPRLPDCVGHPIICRAI